MDFDPSVAMTPVMLATQPALQSKRSYCCLEKVRQPTREVFRVGWNSSGHPFGVGIIGNPNSIVLRAHPPRKNLYGARKIRKIIGVMYTYTFFGCDLN
jgi:hypothetical protein